MQEWGGKGLIGVAQDERHNENRSLKHNANNRLLIVSMSNAGQLRLRQNYPALFTRKNAL